MAASPPMHIIVTGPPETSKLGSVVKLYHTILYELDNDWPYVDTWNYPIKKKEVCKTCGGRLYHNPVLTPSQLKRLARQLKVPMKIKRFALASRCGASHD